MDWSCLADNDFPTIKKAYVDGICESGLAKPKNIDIRSQYKKVLSPVSSSDSSLAEMLKEKLGIN